MATETPIKPDAEVAIPESENPTTAALGVDPELEEIKSKVREMEAEAKKLAEMQREVEMAMEQSQAGSSTAVASQSSQGPTTPSGVATTAGVFPTLEEKIEADARSIYWFWVDFIFEFIVNCIILNKNHLH